MYNKEIFKRWNDYIDNLFGPEYFPEDLPYFFRFPQCGTCSYWHILDEDALHYLDCNSMPDDYDDDYNKIIEGIKGKIIKPHRGESGEVIDAYCVSRFYGWCKRFPPSSPSKRIEYSILHIIIRLLLSHTHKYISEFRFPVMPHDECCGEWKKDQWVDDRIEKLSSKKDRTS